jgi:two-component system response regulator YesN
MCRPASILVSTTISIGGKADNIAECGECFRTAQELLKQRFVLGYGRIITQNCVDETLSQGLNYPGELIAELEINIRDRNKEKFMTNYDNLLGLLRDYIYQEVVSVLLQVITHCLHAMNSISLNNIPIKVDFDELNQIFGSMHTLEHTRRWFSHIFDEYLQAIQSLELLKGDKHYHVIFKIREYIQVHYPDPNLNVDQLAGIFNYTANYISKIYKNFTGLYLHDYIKNIRIQNAEKLLKDTDYSIHKISEMTGFSNYNYFFSCFKKKIGLTPTVYRSHFLTEKQTKS